MCHFNDDCEAGEESLWEGETKHFGGASLTAFGCEACGYSDCL
ncbi:hypothetical protein HRTV-14_gp122 [Halorubrum phage HRTV-14]|uniref:Uncharacterized protein n=1 Tax=Halorubrum phage HRTV-14 TaxID=2877994 RepID=A0AAE9BUE7_9CAUD|nr:hypothetical protein HRTV-14_gp122 [Halorubrum phage HRTV-14]